MSWVLFILLILIFSICIVYVKGHNIELSAQISELTEKLTEEKTNLVAEKQYSSSVYKTYLEIVRQNQEILGKYGELTQLSKNQESRIENLYEKLRVAAEIKDKEIKIARQDAVDTQRSVVKGKMAEELSPLMPGFPFNIKDLRFSGQPVDYLCYNGLSNEDIQEVVFIECKSGGAVLNNRQRQIKRAIESGKVRFEIFQID